MKKEKLMKKALTLLMVLCMMIPMSIPVMAETNSLEQEEINVTRRDYRETYDEDISLYVPQIKDTMYAHMYIMYSYEEGSWSYAVSDIQPELSGIRTGTGYAKPTEVQGKIKNNVVDFTVWLSSDYGLTMVTVRAVVDNYGDVTVFILNI